MGNLILQHRPGLIVVSAYPGSTAAHEAFTVLRHELLPQLQNKLQHTAPRILPRLMFVDGRPAMVLRATQAARQEFPDYPPSLLQAISAARLATSPLAEYSRLWDEKNSIAFVPFHPFQSLVPRRMLLDHMERAFVHVTSRMGVEINHVFLHSHLAAPLRFVPGLGPRKAKHLMQAILATGRGVERRTGDLKQMLSAGEADDVVYTNCVAFLQLSGDVSTLDSTRIHPSDYRFAQKIAADAMEVRQDAGADNDMEMRKDPVTTHPTNKQNEQTKHANELRVDSGTCTTRWCAKR